MMRLIERESKGELKAGYDLVMAGFAGREGARRVARARREELLMQFTEDYIRQILEEDEYEICGKDHLWRTLGASEWEETGEGGIFTALWTLSGAYGKGFEVNLHKIPVRQETIEICERYDLNPYRLYSKNAVLLAACNGGQLAEALRRQGIPGAVIGTVSSGIGREICYGEVHGFMERPRQDEIYKILKEAVL